MKRKVSIGLVAVAAVVVALLAAACAEEEEAEKIATAPVEQAASPMGGPTDTAVPPAATDTPVPLPANTPLPPPPPSVVYLKGNDLWLASLDGLTTRQITSGSQGAGYAGHVRREDGGIDLYYTSLESLFYEDFDGVILPRGGIFSVYRYALGGGPASKLFSFEGDDKNVEFSTSNASVSPDDRYIAYVDQRGLAVFDLETGKDRPILANVPCNGTGCHGYFFPQWSPRGEVLLGQKIFFEGGVLFLVRPLDPLPQETHLDLTGLVARWAPDGRHVCINLGLYEQDTVVVLDTLTLEWVDLGAALPDLAQPLPAFPNTVRARGCAWSDDGHVAFAYEPQVGEAETRIAVVTASGHFVLQSNPIEKGGEVHFWLPGDEGIIYSLHRTALAQAEFRVLGLDGSLTPLPFDADFVLGVVP